MKPNFERGLAFIFGFMGALVLGLAVALALNTQRTAGIFRELDAGNQIMQAVEDVLVDLLNMQTATRGFLLTGDETYLQPYHEGASDMARALRALQQACAHKPAQAARAQRIAACHDELAGLLTRRIADRRIADFRATLNLDNLRLGKQLMDEVRQLVAAIEQEERAIRQRHSEAMRREAAFTLGLVISLGAFAAGAIAYGAVRTVREYRARTAADTALRLLNEDLERLVAARTAALHDGEERLRLALDAGRIGIFDWDVVGGHLTWSRWHELIWGYAPGEFRGQFDAFTSRVHPEDLPGISAAIEQCRRERRPYEREFRVVWPDGSVHWIQGRGEFVFAADGQAIRMRGTVVEITAHRLAEIELTAQREQTQALARRLLGVQEEERRLLAHELHDELGQGLTALKLTLQAIQRVPHGDVPKRLDIAVDFAARCLEQTRGLSLRLRPPMLDDFGLIPALRWLVEQQTEAGPQVTLTGDLAETRVGSEVETAAFRIAQEALTNALRHAQATAIGIEVARPPGALSISVGDNGRGFDYASARSRLLRDGTSLGLLGLEERARLAGGRLELTSAPGRGTRITATFPLAS